MESIDITGKRFGQLVAVARAESTGDRTRWLCKCDCGNEKIFEYSNLVDGRTKTCGARVHKIKNLTGKRFGKLTVLSLANEEGPARWLCECECGNKKIVLGTSLTNGNTTSCGCVQKHAAAETGKASRTHGETKTALYRVWCGMKTRTENPNCDHYEWYGKRGIKVCEEWKESFTAFRNWALENGYKKGLSIDRIDNNLGYAPNNCRWITVSENVKKSLKERNHGTKIPSNA